MITSVLSMKIDLAFKAVDAAKLQAYGDKHLQPRCKETQEAFRSLDCCFDLLENL